MKSDERILKFLLDEQLPPRHLLRMNKRSRFNIRHICHDYKCCGITDHAVLKRAEKEKRILVTGDNDFLKTRQIHKNTAIVKFDKSLTPAEIDSLFTKLIGKYKNKNDYLGKILSISKRCVEEHYSWGETKKITL